MNQQQLTLLNLGQSLDDLANLDPRGYGVCKILYSASRKLTSEPLCVNAAKKLIKTVKPNDIVYVMTGFVLYPYACAETDGGVSSMLFCRSLVKALGAKPVIVCPQESVRSVKALAACVGLHLTFNLSELNNSSVMMGAVVFTKDKSEAEIQAQYLLDFFTPKAVVSIECPGANEKGVYHNAVGLDVTALQAKQDVLFTKAQEKGILNIAIGDLGNEIGMGAISAHLSNYIPYAAGGNCSCGCSAGIAAATKADNIITATVSDWGCYALISIMAYLKEDIDVMLDGELLKRAMITACENDLIDMYGWKIPSVDGFGLELTVPLVSLMREMISQAFSLKDKCKKWFEKVDELGFFDV